MKNEDFQLEELETAAVNKSNNAKRIAASAGLLAAGGSVGAGVAYGLSQGNNPVVEPVEELDDEDILDVANAGARQVGDPEQYPENDTNTTHANGGSRQTTTPRQDDSDVSFNRTTQYYDENGDLVQTVEDGKVDGYDFRLVDYDGDGKADVMGIDVNGDGVYDTSEMQHLSGEDQIQMGHQTNENVAVLPEQPTPEIPEEPEPYVIDGMDHPEMAQEDPLAREKAGEEFTTGTPDEGDGTLVAENDDPDILEGKEGYYDDGLAENTADDAYTDFGGGDSYDML